MSFLGCLTLYDTQHSRVAWEGTAVSYSVFRKGNSVSAVLWRLTNTDKGSPGQLTFCNVMPNQLQKSNMKHSSSASQLPNTPELFSPQYFPKEAHQLGARLSHLCILIFCTPFLLIFPSLTTYNCLPNANTFFIRSVVDGGKTPQSPIAIYDVIRQVKFNFSTVHESVIQSS